MLNSQIFQSPPQSICPQGTNASRSRR